MEARGKCFSDGICKPVISGSVCLHCSGVSFKGSKVSSGFIMKASNSKCLHWTHYEMGIQEAHWIERYPCLYV